jgi:hypothetical protein
MMKYKMLLAIILAICSIPLAQAGTYDNFRHPKWKSFASGGVKVAEVSEHLEINFPTTASGKVFSAGYASTCRLDGDFDLRANYAALVYPTGNGVRVGIMIDPVLQGNGALVNNTWASVEIFSDFPNTSYATDFRNYQSNLNIIPTNNKKGMLRLTRSGSVLAGFYWDAANMNWIKLDEAPSFTTAPIYFVLTAWSHDGNFANKEVKVTFDNVVLTQGVCKK